MFKTKKQSYLKLTETVKTNVNYLIFRNNIDLT